ncbi:hypothetical protein NHX12_022068, partial [Muraenolepis orangiensis]
MSDSVRNGHITRVIDNDIQSQVLEVEGANVSTTYITFPADPKETLGIKLPFIVMDVKNLNKFFTFEIEDERYRLFVPIAMVSIVVGLPLQR